MCGTSELTRTGTAHDRCVRESTAAHGASLCEELGARLCTADEAKHGEGSPETCALDTIFTWTWIEDPSLPQCPARAHRAFAGRAGTWIQLPPNTVPDAFHELHLRVPAGGGQFAFAGIYDNDAKLVPQINPLVHVKRNTGSMLRFNITQIQKPLFVHIASPEESLPLTLSVSVPTTYEWLPATTDNDPNTTVSSFASSLDMGNGPVLQELPFSFSYFNISYHRVWVAVNGFISFEEPADGFVQFNSIAAAIADWREVRVTWISSQAEVAVTWSGLLFNATDTSAVSLNFRSDGTIRIAWQVVDLSNGGSLSYRRLPSLSMSPVVSDDVATHGGSAFQSELVSRDSNASQTDVYAWEHTEYEWIETSAETETIPLHSFRGQGGCDDGYYVLSLPFLFNWYGVPQMSIVISTYGVIT